MKFMTHKGSGLSWVAAAVMLNAQAIANGAERKETSGHDRIRNIVYKEVDDKKVKLDAYIPTKSGPHPGVLVIHGGAWFSGSKSQLARYARTLADRGYSCFSVNYRLAPANKSPAQIEDCRDAVRWIRRHAEEYKVDPSRIGAIGYSAGGQLVSLLATTGLSQVDDPMGVGTKINVAIAGGAPTDFRTLDENSKTLAFWLGGTRAELPESYAEASPAAHVDSGDAPIFFFHGDRDRLVPVISARSMHQKLKDIGIQTDIHVIEGSGHMGAVFRPEALEKGFTFLDQHLKPGTSDGSLRIFILAGQSNMEGQGVVDLDHPKYYNGGKGILKNVMKNPKMSHLYGHLTDSNGDWVTRDDVHVRFRVKGGLKKGGLSIGYTGYNGRHHIGPELQFGHVVGDAIEEPVLLVKTAWGGKSIHKDFRPPSSDGKTGEFYNRMIAEVHEALNNLAKDFPSLEGREVKLSGLVWFQGWNDMFDEKAREEYESNLANLIKDVRDEFDEPDLPVVIGELGNGGHKAGKKMLAIRTAQAAAANRQEFTGTVAFVKTTSFARPAEASPNVGHGHHWFGNAESYFLIGDALGREMLKVLK